MPHRRAHRRTYLRRDVLLAPVDENGRSRGLFGDGDLDQPAAGTMLDISCGGVAVELDDPLDIGTVVDVHIKGSDGLVQRARGKVNNTRFTKGVLTVGIAFDEPIVILGDPRRDGDAVGVDETTPLVLIVDDDEGVRTVLSRFLERRGLDVATASGGTEALGLIRERAPSLMLLDLRMADMNGLQVLEAIRNESLRVPHIWAMSGLASDEEATEAMTLGAAEFLNKPFDLDHIDDGLTLLSVVL